MIRRTHPCTTGMSRWKIVSTSSEPILAGIGRYGSYVQHKKTYANLDKGEDVLAIGGCELR